LIELLILLLLLLLLLILLWLPIRIVVLGLILSLLRNNISARLKIVRIIGEQIILFGINNRFYDDSSFLALILQHVHNDVHDLRDHRGEALENLVNYTLAHLLKHMVHVLEEVKGRLSELFELWLDKVYKHIN
jgi:ABC-type glucose/galactose transport system permease subunit